MTDRDSTLLRKSKLVPPGLLHHNRICERAGCYQRYQQTNLNEPSKLSQEFRILLCLAWKEALRGNTHWSPMQPCQPPECLHKCTLFCMPRGQDCLSLGNLAGSSGFVSVWTFIRFKRFYIWTELSWRKLGKKESEKAYWGSINLQLCRHLGPDWVVRK